MLPKTRTKARFREDVDQDPRPNLSNFRAPCSHLSQTSVLGGGRKNLLPKFPNKTKRAFQDILTFLVSRGQARVRHNPEYQKLGKAYEQEKQIDRKRSVLETRKMHCLQTGPARLLMFVARHHYSEEIVAGSSKMKLSTDDACATGNKRRNTCHAEGQTSVYSRNWHAPA